MFGARRCSSICCVRTLESWEVYRMQGWHCVSGISTSKDRNWEPSITRKPNRCNNSTACLPIGLKPIASLSTKRSAQWETSRWSMSCLSGERPTKLLGRQECWIKPLSNSTWDRCMPRPLQACFRTRGDWSIARCLSADRLSWNFLREDGCPCVGHDCYSDVS